MKTEILSLRPVQLVVKDAGPFKMLEPFVVAFPGPHRGIGDGNGWVGGSETIELRRPARPPTAAERDRSLANLCFFYEDRGDGILVILDCIYCLFDLTSATAASSGRAASRLEIRPGSRVQLDMLAVCAIEGALREIVLSLWIGEATPIVDWEPALRAGIWQETAWARIGFDPVRLEAYESPDPLGPSILEAIRSAEAAADPAGHFVHHAAVYPSQFRTPLPAVVRVGRRRRMSGDWRIEECREGYAPARILPSNLESLGSRLFERLDTLEKADQSAILAELADRSFDGTYADIPHLRSMPAYREVAVDTGHGPRPLHSLDIVEQWALMLQAELMLSGSTTTLLLLERLDSGLSSDQVDSLLGALGRIIEKNSGTTVMAVAEQHNTVRRFLHHPFSGGIVKGGARGAGLYE